MGRTCGRVFLACCPMPDMTATYPVMFVFYFTAYMRCCKFARNCRGIGVQLVPMTGKVMRAHDLLYCCRISFQFVVLFSFCNFCFWAYLSFRPIQALCERLLLSMYLENLLFALKHALSVSMCLCMYVCMHASVCIHVYGFAFVNLCSSAGVTHFSAAVFLFSSHIVILQSFWAI